MKRNRTTPLADTNKLDDSALVSGKTAQHYFGISRTTRYRREKAGTFPKSCNGKYVMGELRARARNDAGARS